MSRIPDTDIPMIVSRYVRPESCAKYARTLQDSGVVDYTSCWDQLTSWYPPDLWRDSTPIATSLPDHDSFPDVHTLLAYVSGVAPELGTAVSVDAIRRGPAELTQMMMTLAWMTRGKSQFHIGAGELKQCKPFGYRRKEGLARLEDQFRAFQAFWNSDKPIDLDGNIWKLRNAWLGGAKGHRPQVWALGGGPKLMDLATTYADGFASCIPWVFRSPDEWGTMVADVKQELERKGRDPEAFGFGVYAGLVIHEDDEVIEEVLENDIMKWTTAIFGRLKMEHWVEEGFEPPFPVGWHYALKLLTVEMPRSEIDEHIANVTPEMGRRSYICGTAEEVAAELQKYVDAGATWIQIMDCLPLVRQEKTPAVTRAIDVCRILKQGRTGNGLAQTTTAHSTDLRA